MRPVVVKAHSHLLLRELAGATSTGVAMGNLSHCRLERLNIKGLACKKCDQGGI